MVYRPEILDVSKINRSLEVQLMRYENFKKKLRLIYLSKEPVIEGTKGILENNITDPFNGHAYVDLGLPSGTLWATMNVGASSEIDYGLYFAWGETQGYTAELVSVDKDFDWDDYKFNPTSDGETFSKYNATDLKIKLDTEDDAAHVNMGGQWHMPTKEQLEELLSTANCTNEWVSDYNGSDINGRLFTSVKNGNTMFIPAAGFCLDGNVNGVDGGGSIWASVLRSEYVSDAWLFTFTSDYADVFYGNRGCGYSVRGVIGNIPK